MEKEGRPMDFANLRATDANGVQKLVQKAMMDAKPADGHFGYTGAGGQGSSAELEHKFQDALLSRLCGLTGEKWRWWKEQPLHTQELTNSQRINIDIVGQDADYNAVAIELKYVTLSYSTEDKAFRPPSDAPAFPYDVVKDALKIELLLRHEAELELELERVQANIVYGMSIALTNDSRFWRQNGRPPRGWSREFGQAFVNGGDLPRVMRTRGRNPDNCIFIQKRCHISLGVDWHLEWHDFSKVDEFPEEAARFRYAVLSPDIRKRNSERWEMEYLHDRESRAFVPFLKRESRKRFFDMRAEMQNG